MKKEYNIDMEPLKKGDQVNDGNRTYEILELTENAGGFGRIYRAKSIDPVSFTPIAIKEFYLNNRSIFVEGTRVSLFTQEVNMYRTNSLIEQFKREALMLCTMSMRVKNHIPWMYSTGSFEYDGRLMYAMEYIEGPTLRECIVNGIPYEEKIALQYTTQIAKVIHNTHNYGFIHRDVSPNNIIIDCQKGAILLDFGNAKAYNENIAIKRIIDRLNHNGLDPNRYIQPIYLESDLQPVYDDLGIGTNHFKAPSYMQNEMCDIYSLAAVLYYMLTGEYHKIDVSNYTLQKEKLQERKISDKVTTAIECALLGRIPNVTDFLKELPSETIFNALLDF